MEQIIRGMHIDAGMSYRNAWQVILCYLLSSHLATGDAQSVLKRLSSLLHTHTHTWPQGTRRRNEWETMYSWRQSAAAAAVVTAANTAPPASAASNFNLSAASASASNWPHARSSAASTSGLAHGPLWQGRVHTWVRHGMGLPHLAPHTTCSSMGAS